MIVLFDYENNGKHREISINAADEDDAMQKIKDSLTQCGIQYVDTDKEITIYDKTTGPVAGIMLKGDNHEKTD